jgi:hypothetical protein
MNNDILPLFCSSFIAPCRQYDLPSGVSPEFFNLNNPSAKTVNQTSAELASEKCLICRNAMRRAILFLPAPCAK